MDMRRRTLSDATERTRRFRSSRVGPDGLLVAGQYAAALATRRLAERDQPPPPTLPGGAGSFNWTPIGPSVVGLPTDVTRRNYSGRVTACAVGPTSSRAYVGGANGGVWLYTAASQSWSPVDDYQTSTSVTPRADALAVGAVAVRFGATQAADVLYVGTGESNEDGSGAVSSDAYFGIGILRSTAGGASGSWSVEAGTAGQLLGKRVARLVIDPDDASADTVVAATSAGIWVRSAGGIWTHATVGLDNPGGVATDVCVVGSASTGNKLYYAAFGQNRVYKSTNGMTWIAMPDIAAAPGRIVLGASESDTTVYAYRGDGTCWRLESGAFVAVSGAPNDDPGGNWYHLVLAVDPTDPDVIYIGGLWVYRATLKKTGGKWSMTAVPYYNVHMDAHAVAFAKNANDPNHDPNDVWIGVDGGVYRSTSPTSQSSMAPRNVGLAITEPYTLATRADTDGVALIGTQDLGTHLYVGESAWLQTQDNGGDGGGVAIDPGDPFRMLKAINTQVWSSVDGGTGPVSSWTQLPFPGSGEAWLPPIKTTPAGVSPTLAFVGTTQLWMTPDWGGSWVTLPANTNPSGSAAQDVIDNSPIVAIAAASATRVFTCTGTHVRRFDGPSTPWSATSIPTAGLPASYSLTGLAPEIGNAFYASIGYSTAGHLYYFDGVIWHEAMAASVLDSPAHAVVVDPANPAMVYVGTDVGVWQGVRSGLSWTWTVFSYGLPESSVNDMLLHDPARVLRAATHGRGVWEVALEAAVPTNQSELYLRVDYADSGRIRATGQRSGFVDAGLADPYKPPPNPGALYHWKSPDIKVRRLSLAAPLATPVDYLDFATHIGDKVDSAIDHETADIAGANQVFVEVHNRAVITPATQISVLTLMTDASLALPPLPAGWAAQVNALNPSPAWLGGDWHFADPAAPYRQVAAPIDVRNPAVVSYDSVTFGSLGLPAGHEHVCIAAFVTSPGDPILVGAQTSLDAITMSDRHVAFRNVHLVSVGAQPSPPSGQYKTEAHQVTFDIHNPFPVPAEFTVAFQRGTFTGHLSLATPRLRNVVLDWFDPGDIDQLPEVVRRPSESWFRARDEQVRRVPADPARLARKLGRLRAIDANRVLVAGANPAPTLRGLRLEPYEAVPVVMTLYAPSAARPGDRFTIDVVQRHGERILGGSTFVLAIYGLPG